MLPLQASEIPMFWQPLQKVMELLITLNAPQSYFWIMLQGSEVLICVLLVSTEKAWDLLTMLHLA